MVNSAMETKNPARCTMSMSATHTSGFNTGSDNQNKWLLFPLYSTCQHSPLKGGGGGDARGLGSDVARPRPGPGRGAGPSPGRAPRPRAARINICFAGPGPGAAARAGRRRWRRSLRSPRSGARGGLRPGDRAARLGSLRGAGSAAAGPPGSGASWPGARGAPSPRGCCGLGREARRGPAGRSLERLRASLKTSRANRVGPVRGQARGLPGSPSLGAAPGGAAGGQGGSGPWT